METLLFGGTAAIFLAVTMAPVGKSRAPDNAGKPGKPGALHTLREGGGRRVMERAPACGVRELA